MKLNHEVRFDLSKDIIERLDKLILILGRKKHELARILFLRGLELAEEKISEGCLPIYVPIPNSKILKIRFEEKGNKFQKIPL